MLILAIRTDNPTAELYLTVNEKQLAKVHWLAHRQLAETIHAKIEALLTGHKKQLSDIEGIVIFKGPGSFTGLRIGFSVANALADGLAVPIVACQHDDWLSTGIAKLQHGINEHISFPEYGALPNITLPKH